jgi:5'-methylthioadenosine nucleosidase
MEAAAIAWIASHYKTPLIAIKSVTDLMDSDHSTAEEFEANLALASENLRTEVLKLLDLLATQPDTAAA